MATKRSQAEIDEANRTAAEHWSLVRQTGRTRWWTSPIIHRHINRLVCGEPLDGAWAGLQRRMEEMAPPGGFARAISLGCGHGGKELELLALGLVQHFDLYEISEARVEQGRAKAVTLGVSDRVTYRVADAFQENLPTDYDLVYWNNALHHMLDVPAAVRWSSERLRPGGAFVMDDYVGASRFQWSDYQLAMGTRVREELPARFLRRPQDPEKTLPTVLRRQSAESLMKADPTEAADSERIIPAVRKVFPDAEVILTGGVIYHTGLNDVLANFVDGEDDDLLRAILLVDEALANAGETQYAVALAVKGSTSRGLRFRIPRPRSVRGA